MTCTDNCPLSTDASILYQDFLFTAPVSLTGVQITLSEWTGDGAGLHLLQLLSSGAFVSAVSSQNTQSCFAPNPSNIVMTGTWSPEDTDTNIPATLQTVLVSTVPVGTPAAQAPSFTWMPYVSASGQYIVNMVIPGCLAFQDCPLRTSVQVTVFPGDGSQPFVSTVSQQVQNDVVVPIYTGPIVPSPSSFVATVTMTLADQPAGDGQDGEYKIVAGNIELVLTSTDVTSGGTGNGSTSLGTQRGFGFFEWPLNSKSTVNATGLISNVSETAADIIGVDLYDILGSTNTNSAYISIAVQHPSGVVFLGGSFTFATGSLSGTSNIVAYKQGGLFALANGGLNGVVTSFALYGNKLYVGGAFSDTRTPSTQGRLSGVAMYDIGSNSWSTLGAGVNGPVSTIALVGTAIQVAGNFTTTITLGGSSSSVGGFATWDITTSSWVNSGGFVRGNFTFLSNATSSSGQEVTQLLAGNVQSLAKYGANGMVMLSNSGSDDPTVTPLGVQFGSSVNVSLSTTTAQKRHAHSRRGPAAWFPHVRMPLFKRQSSTSPSVLPPSPSTLAPAVLAGVFWSNSTSSHEVAIIGGNFSFLSSSGSSQAVAVYDPTTSTVSALAGDQVYGVVRALYVDANSHLYVGGEFNLASANVNGFAVYDLVGQQWLGTIAQPIQANPGSSVAIRSITTTSYKSNSIIVAGSFTQAGTVACQGICLFDTTLNQWNTLGSGLKGNITSVSYAGVRLHRILDQVHADSAFQSNQDVLIAAGIITLADGTSANVAQYSFANNTWSAVGDPATVPGPVTAVEVNNGNSSSIFAAGR